MNRRTPDVVDVCAEPPMRADGLESVHVIHDVMHVHFYIQTASGEAGAMVRQPSGSLAIQMSGVPHGLMLVTAKATGYVAHRTAHHFPAPERIMNLALAALILLDRL